MGTCMQRCMFSRTWECGKNEWRVAEKIGEGLLNKVCVVVRVGRGEGEEKHGYICRSIHVYSRSG